MAVRLDRNHLDSGGLLLLLGPALAVHPPQVLEQTLLRRRRELSANPDQRLTLAFLPSDSRRSLRLVRPALVNLQLHQRLVRQVVEHLDSLQILHNRHNRRDLAELDSVNLRLRILLRPLQRLFLDSLQKPHRALVRHLKLCQALASLLNLEVLVPLLSLLLALGKLRRSEVDSDSHQNPQALLVKQLNLHRVLGNHHNQHPRLANHQILSQSLDSRRN